MKPLLKTKEAARFLNISERKLWELTNRGEIPSVRIPPRSVRYDPIDLRAWIQQKKKRGRRD